MRVPIEYRIISLYLLANACTIISSPILSTHFSAKIRPSKFFEHSPFAHGRNSLVYINITNNYINYSDMMISEIDSDPLNASRVLYKSYFNGRDMKGFFIVDGECIVHDINNIPTVYLMVPSFMSFDIFYFFNLFNRVQTFSYKQCPYHQSLDCEGWTSINSDNKNDNVTFFLHGSTVLHYYTGLAPDKPVVFDEFKPGTQTIDKFEPPKAAKCYP